VIDDIVISVPDELRPADLVILVRAVGGRCAGITKAELTELTDAPNSRPPRRRPTGGRLDRYAETIRALLEADAAEPVVVHKPDARRPSYPQAARNARRGFSNRTRLEKGP